MGLVILSLLPSILQTSLVEVVGRAGSMRLMMVPCCSSGITTRSSPSTGSLPETEPEHCRRGGHRSQRSQRGSPSTGSLPETEPEHCRRGGHRGVTEGSPSTGSLPETEPEHCRRGGHRGVTEGSPSTGSLPETEPEHCPREVTGHRGVTVHRLTARDRARTLPEGRSQVTEVTEGSSSTGSLPETEPEHCRRGGHRSQPCPVTMIW